MNVDCEQYKVAGESWERLNSGLTVLGPESGRFLLHDLLPGQDRREAVVPQRMQATRSPGLGASE